MEYADKLIEVGRKYAEMCHCDYYKDISELAAHDDIQAAYEDRRRWNTMSIENIAKAARFAADRSIRDYADRIWNTAPVSDR